MRDPWDWGTWDNFLLGYWEKEGLIPVNDEKGQGKLGEPSSEDRKDPGKKANDDARPAYQVKDKREIERERKGLL